MHFQSLPLGTVPATPPHASANDEFICDIHEALEEDVNLAVDAAQAAFEDWK